MRRALHQVLHTWPRSYYREFGDLQLAADAPRAVEPEAIREVRVLQTLVNGGTVFEHKDAAEIVRECLPKADTRGTVI